MIKREQLDSHLYALVYDDLYNQFYGQVSVTSGKWTFDYIYSNLTLQYYHSTLGKEHGSLIVNIVLTDLEQRVFL